MHYFSFFCNALNIKINEKRRKIPSKRKNLHTCREVMISSIDIPKKYTNMHTTIRANKLASLCSHYERLKYKHKTIAFLYSINGPFENAIHSQ